MKGFLSDSERRNAGPTLAHPDLTEVVKHPGNEFCADCGAKGPRWAGVHRGMGVHISKVKSLTLDKWTPEWIRPLRMIGNDLGKAYYEYRVPNHYKRPTQNDAKNIIDTWIKNKYARKLFTPPDSPEPWEFLAKDEDPNLSVPGRVESLAATKASDDANLINGTEKSKKKKSVRSSSNRRLSNNGLNSHSKSSPALHSTNTSSTIPASKKLPTSTPQRGDALVDLLDGFLPAAEVDFNILSQPQQQSSNTKPINPPGASVDLSVLDFNISPPPSAPSRPSTSQSTTVFGFDVSPPSPQQLQEAKLEAARTSISQLFQPSNPLGFGSPSFPLITPILSDRSASSIPSQHHQRISSAPPSSSNAFNDVFTRSMSGMDEFNTSFTNPPPSSSLNRTPSTNQQVNKDTIKPTETDDIFNFDFSSIDKTFAKAFNNIYTNESSQPTTSSSPPPNPSSAPSTSSTNPPPFNPSAFDFSTFNFGVNSATKPPSNSDPLQGLF